VRVAVQDPAQHPISGSKRDQVQEVKRLGTVYEHVQKMEGVKKDVMTECKNNYHDTAKELALIWHKEAQRTKNADTYQLTRLIYKEYLDHFQNEKDTPEMTFYFGEILWVTEQWPRRPKPTPRLSSWTPRAST